MSQVREKLPEETLTNFKGLILRDVRERLEPARGDDPLVVAPVLSRKELEEGQRGGEPDLGRDRQAAKSEMFQSQERTSDDQLAVKLTCRYLDRLRTV